MGFDVAMDQIAVSQELECTRELLEEMPNHDLIERTDAWVRVLGDHIPRKPVVSQRIPPLDEE